MPLSRRWPVLCFLWGLSWYGGPAVAPIERVRASPFSRVFFFAFWCWTYGRAKKVVLLTQWMESSPKRRLLTQRQV
ncbi:hypothetical protein V8C43DRAFT_288759 [Trichoderma afarasin]